MCTCVLIFKCLYSLSYRKTGRLKQILPEEFRDTSGIEQNILKVVEVVRLFRNVIVC